MCYSPIIIRNPTKRIALQGGQKLLLSVPCGKCHECCNNKRGEWYFRTYQHVQYTLKRGGYVLFDTLTYDDEHIPHLSYFVDITKYNVDDITCFSRSDFNAFMKRLRSLLRYRNKNYSLEYFMTSEYGVDPRFTRRPHYHVLLFCTGIEPLELSRCVSSSWQYGRTDGIKYKPLKYVASHIYGFDLGFGNNTSFKAVTKTCNYVSKYITKHCRYNSTLMQKLELLRCSDMLPEDIDILKREIDMFHRQSQGFGLSYLNSTDKRDLQHIANDECVMYDSDKIINVIPMPMYYKRHLYYVQKKRSDGTVYWEKTAKGIEHDMANFTKRVKDKTDQLYKKYTTFPRIGKEIIAELLGNRTLEDLSVYMLYYQGRLRDIEHLPDELLSFRSYATELTDNECNLYSWIDFINKSVYNNSLPDKSVLSVVSNAVSGVDEVFYNGQYITYKQLIDNHTICDRSSPHFKDFDKILDVFNACSAYNGAILQSSFDYIEELKEKYKTKLL